MTIVSVLVTAVMMIVATSEWLRKTIVLLVGIILTELVMPSKITGILIFGRVPGTQAIRRIGLLRSGLIDRANCYRPDSLPRTRIHPQVAALVSDFRIERWSAGCQQNHYRLREVRNPSCQMPHRR